MKVLTVRGVDGELAARIKKAARDESISVNQFVLNLLKSYFGQTKEKRFTRQYHDLDHLFGGITQEEYQQMKEAVEAQRKIDPDLWT
ncbi:MAG: antitoxin [bacterium]